MTHMKKIIASLVGCLVLALPGAASAHTGSVTCNSTGVVFSYANNFAANTLVTETVNGVTYQITVTAHVARTHTVPTPAAYVVAKSAYSGGTLSSATLTCPYTPPVTVVEKIVYVDRPVEVIKEVQVPGPTVYVDRPVPTTVYKTKTKIVYKYKTRWRVIYKFIEIKPEPKPHGGRVPGGGVTG